MTREEGVEAFAWVSLNSGSLGRFSSIAFGFRVTISSRHWGVLAGLRGLWSFVGPVGVIIVSWDCGGWFSGEGGTDSKAWMGRASKNSWAIMKGLLSSSVVFGMC